MTAVPSKSARPRPRRRTQEERTALSDERMLRAAIELLVSRGAEGTTLAAIGQRAGYSRGLVTHRYGSKAGLFAHLMSYLSREWLRRLNAAVGGRSGLAAIHGAIDALAGFAAEEPKDLRAMYLLWFQTIDPGAEYRADLAKIHAAQRRDIEGWIRDGQRSGEIAKSVDPKRAAIMMAVSIAGLVFHWLVSPALPIQQLHRQLKNDMTTLLSAGAGRARKPGR